MVYVSLTLVVSVRVIITDGANSDGTTLHTAFAQRSKVTFSDHSIVELNAGTLVLLKEGVRRQIFLQEGEIRLSIQHGVSKPADVHIGNILLQDLGTQFDVSVHERSVNAVVTDGLVRVQENRPDGSLVDPIDVTGTSHQRHPMVLKKGDMIRLDERDGAVFAYVSRNDLIEAEMRSSWLNGELATTGQRLDEVIVQFNRYNRVPIVINDPSVAQMKVGGHYYLTDSASFLFDLRHALGLEVVPVSDGNQNVVQMNLLRAPANGITCDRQRPPAPKRH
jgi:transmembrane sensor